MFEVIIIWYTGEKEKYIYKTEKEAKNCIDNMKKVFGQQIAFTCINH